MPPRRHVPELVVLMPVLPRRGGGASGYSVEEALRGEPDDERPDCDEAGGDDYDCAFDDDEDG